MSEDNLRNAFAATEEGFLSIAERVDFFSVSPLGSSLIHWVVGIFYMLHISIFVSFLRGVLRNGVLYFLRDPADHNYNPFRDLIDDPVHKHARRVFLSVAVYGSLIVILVFLPIKLVMRVAPSIFPLEIFVSDPFTEIPADMLLFQLCIPFALEHFKFQTTIKSLLIYWFIAIGWALDLTDFLLPAPEDSSVQENGYAEPLRQDRQQLQLGGQEAIVGHSSNIVFKKQGMWRIKGIIQVSRAIGDAYLKKPEFALDARFPRFHLREPIQQPVLRADPSVYTREWKPADRFLIFASDGLWDHVSNQRAVEIAFKNPIAGIARRLLKSAINEAAKKSKTNYAELKKLGKGVRRRFHVDITIVVIFIGIGCVMIVLNLQY